MISLDIHKQSPGRTALRNEIISALSSPTPFLPAKLHYDERGSELFESICNQPEYYLTRTETEILATASTDIANTIGPDAAVIEPGSGASLKTEILIEAFEDCAGYIPIDISESMLAIAANRTAKRFPGLPIAPVHADFMVPLDLPAEAELGRSRVLFFPGSTIGNFEPAAQEHVLQSFAHLAGANGSLLVGFDRVKAQDRLEAAYNDAAGVTAEFNLNVLDRLENEFGLPMGRHDFKFHSYWNAERQAIVSSVVAKHDVSVSIDQDHMLEFPEGTRIQTEESHKYTNERIDALAERCDLEVSTTWSDSDEDFTLALLTRR